MSPGFEVLKRLPRNTAGRDFVVGDIHGEFDKLHAELERVMFDRERDRLFAVGDLVDRGPDSEKVANLLMEPWFFSVMGNHELMAIEYHLAQRHGNDGQAGEHLERTRRNYIRNGGQWFVDLVGAKQAQLVLRFLDFMPLAAEVGVGGGVVGLVHGDPVRAHWPDLIDGLNHDSTGRTTLAALWGRTRIERRDTTPVAGIGRVYCGHTPLFDGPVQLGNVRYLDTGGCFAGGRLTLEQIGDLL